MDLVNIVFYILVLGLITLFILYITGLGLLTTAMFNIMPCGCTQTNVSGGIAALIKSSGTNSVVVKPEIPLVTSIIPISDKKKLNLSSIEVGISKMSIIVTWLIMSAIIIFGIVFTWASVIGPVIIVIVALAYLPALGILSTQIFSLGNCGCNIVVSTQLGTAAGFANIKNERFVDISPLPSLTLSAPVLAGSPATVVTIPAGSTYSIEQHDSESAIGYSKFGLIFTWIIYLIILFGLIISKF